jgi:catechol 2,3-dioxygenase-like lactoylglutathione lyase family enzyme
MKQHIAAVTLLVPDYDEAIAYYVGKLGFKLIEDTALSPTKRWVVVAPPGNSETGLLLARADSPNQRQAIGNQTGGRVFLILKTDDFNRDFARFKQAGIEFWKSPARRPMARSWCSAIPSETSGICSNRLPSKPSRFIIAFHKRRRSDV